MIMNTWELSGVIVSIGECAANYARKVNQCINCNFDIMEHEYTAYIYGLRRALQCINGFDLEAKWNADGYYTMIYITYHDNICGDPWQIAR